MKTLQGFFETRYGRAVLPTRLKTCSTCIFFGKKGETPHTFCALFLQRDPIQADTNACEDYEALKR